MNIPIFKAYKNGKLLVRQDYCINQNGSPNFDYCDGLNMWTDEKDKDGDPIYANDKLRDGDRIGTVEIHHGRWVIRYADGGWNDLYAMSQRCVLVMKRNNKGRRSYDNE